MNYKQAINFIQQRRKNQLIAAENAYFDALDKFPELKAADEKYRQETLAAIKSGNTELAQKAKNNISEVLTKLGLIGIVRPAPYCLKCGDKGFINGKYCDCVRALTIGNDLIAFPLHDFDGIDYNLFDENDEKSFRGVVRFLKIAFDEKFPNTKSRIFSLLGNSGTGKTYLASCCVNAVLKKGYTPVFITAFEFVSRAAKYHTTFDETRDVYLQPLLDCDLLVIDDLGTEAIYKNITLEYLYLVINERQIKGRHTMITSNLTITTDPTKKSENLPNDLQKRYGAHITSRLLDDKTCYSHEFTGKDIRKKDIKLE